MSSSSVINSQYNNNNNNVHDDAITLFYREPFAHVKTQAHTHAYTRLKNVSRYYHHRNIGPMQIRCRKQVTIIIFVELLLLYDIAFCGCPGTTFNIYYIHVIAAVILLLYTIATSAAAAAAAVKASLL